MGSFKKVLVLTCISEMMFSAVNLVFILTLTIQEATYFVVVDGAFGHLSPFWTRVGYFCFVTMVYVSVYNTAIVFFFRYLMVCRSKTLNAWLFALCVGFGWIIVILYTVAILYNCHEPPRDAKIDILLTSAGFPSNAGSFQDYLGCDLINASPFSLYGAFAFTTLVYGAIILMSFAIQCSFKRLRSLLSNEEKRFHKEVTFILWIEALTPFITVVLPIYYDISAFILPKRPFDWYAEFQFFLTIIGPSFTAILKMLSMKAYRQAIILKLRKICCGRNNEVTLFTQSRMNSSALNSKVVPSPNHLQN
uniref:G_PROTEIN_RECEP_F1_2 domain-containing protein n=1 Tax=Panagrellus redivivus TaxID=6233 RepID=A0A7E5A1M0_PANRE